jgi:hypothetical protein
MRAADEQRHKLEAAKNDLEAHVISTREFFDNTEGASTICSEDEKEKVCFSIIIIIIILYISSFYHSSIVDIIFCWLLFIFLLRDEQIFAELAKVEEWLYEEGMDQTIDVYQAKLVEISSVSAPARLRFNELTARPEAVEVARVKVAAIYERVVSWNETKPWINETDKMSLVNKTNRFETWLNESEAKQTEASLLEEPVFTSKDVDQKFQSVEIAFKRLARIPKPQPPKQPSNTTGSRNSTKPGKSGKGGKAKGAEAEVPVGEGEGVADDIKAEEQGDEGDRADEAAFEDIPNAEQEDQEQGDAIPNDEDEAAVKDNEDGAPKESEKKARSEKIEL